MVVGGFGDLVNQNQNNMKIACLNMTGRIITYLTFVFKWVCCCWCCYWSRRRWYGLDRYTHEHLYQLHWQQWRQPSIVYFVALLPHRTLNISGIYLGSWCGTILYDDAMVNMESLCPSPKCIYTSAHCNLLSSLQSWRHSNIKYHCRLWYLLLFFFWWI